MHEILFDLLLVAVALHVLAVVAYAVLRRHDLVRAMVTGRKTLPASMPAPWMGSPVLAAALLAGAALVVFGITRLG